MPLIVHDGTGCWINSNFSGQRFAASSKIYIVFFILDFTGSDLIKVVAHFEERCHLKYEHRTQDPSLMVGWQRSTERINVDVIPGSVDGLHGWSFE
jgi:hypothetical protein